MSKAPAAARAGLAPLLERGAESLPPAGAAAMVAGGGGKLPVLPERRRRKINWVRERQEGRKEGIICILKRSPKRDLVECPKTILFLAF